MPVKGLPSNPSLDHLKYQAKDLLKAHAARDPAVAQRIREFHPRFSRAADPQIFDARLTLSDAQLAIARERGFPSWARLKGRVEKPTLADDLNLPMHQRIEDATFRRAVDLLDAGDAAGLRDYLHQHPNLVHQHVVFEGGNYFRDPTLLEFVAENPIRHGALPANIVQVAQVILDAGAKQNLPALNETLGLVCSGRVPRECGVQVPLVDLLCDHGANPNHGMSDALGHAEFDAANALIRRGAEVDLPVAAAMGRIDDARRLLRSGTGPLRPSPSVKARGSQAATGSVVPLKFLRSGTGPSGPSPSVKARGSQSATGSVVPLKFPRSGTGPSRPSPSLRTRGSQAATSSVVPLKFLRSAGSEGRHRALALASQFGHTEIVRLLLDAGEDPNRYNPVGLHSHSTPLHQAALAGHHEVVRLLVDRGARVDLKDTMWQGTPAGWAKHAGKTQIEEYLLAQEARSEDR